MVSLLDIAPASETVTVRGTALPVTGISAEGLAILLQAYPELQKLFAGDGVDITPVSAWELGPKVVASIIAAGTGQPGNAAAEAVAASLGVDEQISLLEPILRSTLPNGIGPFIARLSKLAAVLGVQSIAA